MSISINAVAKQELHAIEHLLHATANLVHFANELQDTQGHPGQTRSTVEHWVAEHEHAPQPQLTSQPRSPRLHPVPAARPN